MSSDEEDLIIMHSLSTLNSQQTNKRKKHRVWVNSYLKERNKKGRFVNDFQDLKMNPELFKENFHMNYGEFEDLLNKLGPKLEPIVKTRPQDSISPEQKLAITLEFLASGTIQRHIASCYRVSKQHIGRIIEKTCHVIFTTLKANYMKANTIDEWNDISNSFNLKWNFPNCLGAIDGKHVAIKCPKNAETCFYNYKGFHSIVLMAVCDADYRFTYIDVGAYGSEGDSSIFRNSEFGRRLLSQDLSLPAGAKILGKNVPHFFVADDAFPLHKRIMKPYKPPSKKDKLGIHERIFNYRLSRARRCIENTFGIMCSRFFVLARTIFMKPERVQLIVSACCVLHNYLIKKSDVYCPPGFCDSYEDNVFRGGAWRDQISQNSLYHNNLLTQNSGRVSIDAVESRKVLTQFVNSSEGSVNWQNSAIFN